MFASCSCAASLRAGIVNAYGRFSSRLPVSVKEAEKQEAETPMELWSSGYNAGFSAGSDDCRRNAADAIQQIRERAEKAERELAITDKVCQGALRREEQIGYRLDDAVERAEKAEAKLSAIASESLAYPVKDSTGEWVAYTPPPTGPHPAELALADLRAWLRDSRDEWAAIKVSEHATTTPAYDIGVTEGMLAVFDDALARLDKRAAVHGVRLPQEDDREPHAGSQRAATGKESNKAREGTSNGD